MKQKEMLRKAAWVAFGLVLAIEVTAIAGESAQEAKTTYAQGQYVHTLGGAESPFSDVVQTVMPCVVGVSNRGNSTSSADKLNWWNRQQAQALL